MAGKHPRPFVAGLVSVLARAASAAAQTVVVEQAALISLTEPVYLDPNITTHDGADHAFVLNHLDDFKASLADISGTTAS